MLRKSSSGKSSPPPADPARAHGTDLDPCHLLTLHELPQDARISSTERELENLGTR